VTARPHRLVFVTGTGTEIGKTWWAAATARALLDLGASVAARKPAQSGGPPSDAEILAAATGQAPTDVCPPHRSYAIAWAPPFAAAELGDPPFTIADLVDEMTWPPGTDVGIVEGAGGPRSPMASDGDNVDLARALLPDFVVVVGDAGLGTINAIRLSVAPFEDVAGARVVAVLNRFGGNSLHVLNLRFLVEREDLDVVTEPRQLAHRLWNGT